MFHFLFDAYNGYRSRLDDIMLVHEFLEEVPLKLGVKSVMPPFVLPYYNGVVTEDCGISAFVFLAGGHFTLHTFSYRGAFFVDFLYPRAFPQEKLRSLIDDVFPSERSFQNYIHRTAGERPERPAVDTKKDFGPHLLFDIEDYAGPDTLDEIFGYLDRLPTTIGMTPIIRPYVVKNLIGGQEVVSGMTMIAESHIGLHIFIKSRKAFFDLFSCTFFDAKKILPEIRGKLKGRITQETLISRGSKYKEYGETSVQKVTLSRAWVGNVFSRPNKR
ncbi:MAG: S-adenosylmethionine decarboxylase [Candidatus Aminicenantes bacterium]|nr:S-adenosylmethionine decarboxylase [Candidatus Aminicenantes bacterium]